MSDKSIRTMGFAAFSLAALAVPHTAFAHHAMDGQLPATFMQGLLSGLGHPVIGLDHLAFIVGLGIVAAVAALGIALPALFVAFMCAGLALHMTGLDLAATEMLIALSVVLVGLAIVRRSTADTTSTSAGGWLEGAIFALAGTVHGYAFAESIIGAEATPLAAYVAGLVIVQVAITLGAYAVTRAIMSETSTMSKLAPRIAGALILAVGVYFAVGAAGVSA